MAHRRPLTILLVTGLIGALGATSALAEHERPRRPSESELRPGWARLHGPDREGPDVRRWSPRRGAARVLPPLALSSSLVRSETILDGSERGLITQRIERGQVASVDDDGLGIELATGETSQLTIGDVTSVVALERAASSGRPRARPRATIVEPVDLEVGATVVAWSRSIDGEAGAGVTPAAEPTAEASPPAASLAQTT